MRKKERKPHLRNAKVSNNTIIMFMIIFFVILFTFSFFLQKSFAATQKTTQQSTKSNVDVNGKIPANQFELSGLPENYNTNIDWSYPTGEITAEKFPEFKDYHFVNATVDGVPISYLGILKRENEPDLYCYLAAGKLEEGISTIILPEGKIVKVNYAFNEFEIQYEITGNIEGITNEDIFGANPQKETVNNSYSFDVNIPSGYTADVYCYKNNDTDTETSEKLTRNISVGNRSSVYQ